MKMLKNLMIPLVLFLAYNLQAQEQKEITVSSFNSVKFEGSARFVLVPSGAEKVVIESNKPDVFDYIDVHNEGVNLLVSATDKNKNITKLFKSVTIKVYFKSLKNIAMSGAGSVNCQEQFSAGELTATLRGAGNMYLDVQCSKFIGNMYGTGSLEAQGTAASAVVRVEGVGGFDGYNLITNDMDITVSGVGGAKVQATEHLTATLNGVGSIRYKGDPAKKDLQTNGLGNIRKVSDDE